MNCRFCDSKLEGSKTKRYCGDKCRQKWNYYNKPRSINSYFAQKQRGYERRLKAIFLKGGKCQKCLESRLPTLCFHHKKPETKSFGLDTRAFANLKWSSIVEELDKCELLCHNCHSIEHSNERWQKYMDGINMASGGQSQPVSKAERIATTGCIVVAGILVGPASTDFVNRSCINIEIFRNVELRLSHPITQTNFINLGVTKEASTATALDGV
jgi:hypothetical protein